MAESTQPWVQPAGGGGTLARLERVPVAPAAGVAARWAAVALAGSWLGYFLITQLPYVELDTFRRTVTLHVVTGAVFVPYLFSLVLRRRLPGGTILDGPIALLIAAYLLTTATSQDWRVSLEVTATVLMAIGAFYVLSDGWLLKRWQLEAALMLAVTAAAVWALWIVAGDYLDWLRLEGAVNADFSRSDLFPPSVLEVRAVGDHKNLLGAILAAGLPFFFVALFRQVSWTMRTLFALAIVALALAIFLSLARSAWAAAVVGSLTSLVLLGALTPRGQALLRELRPSTPGKQTALGAAAFALALVVLGAAYLATSVESRPLWLFRESGTPRADVLGAGAEMLRDHPLVGTGPGVYPLLYPEYSGKDPNHAVHSHNGYLQAAIDMGVPGVVAVALALGALGLLLARTVRDTEGEARLTAIACCGALVAFGAFGLLDSPNRSKGPLIVLAAVVAIVVLAYQERAAPAERRPPGPPLVASLAPRYAVAIAMAAALIIWGRIDLSHYYYSEGLVHANAGRWSAAVEDAQHAVDLDPSYAIYRLQLGVVQGQAYQATGDRRLLEDGIAQLERGTEMEPRSAIGYANLAMMLSEAGQRDQARDAALQALRYSNSDAAVVLSAGTALEKSNWGEDAIRAYSRALYLDVGLADSEFWRGSEFRASRFSDVIGHSALVFNPCVLLSLDLDGVATPLTRSDAIVQCAQQVQASGGEGGKVTLAEAAIEDDKPGEARALLDDVLARQPDFGRARTVLGRWYDEQGQVDRAREEWTRAGQLHEVEALVLLGDSYPQGEVPGEVVDKLRTELNQAASQVQFHITGILYYRLRFFRASPITILLPGEWQQAVPGRYARAQDALARWAAR